MPAARESARPPAAWTIALTASAAASGVGFATSPAWGWAAAGLSLAVFVAFMVWAARRGRRRRAEGDRPDLADLGGRIRARARWLTVLAVVAAGCSALALATSDGSTPVWLFVLPPVLMAFGVGTSWLTALVLLPRAERRQAARSD